MIGIIITGTLIVIVIVSLVLDILLGSTQSKRHFRDSVNSIRPSNDYFATSTTRVTTTKQKMDIKTAAMAIVGYCIVLLFVLFFTRSLIVAVVMGLFGLGLPILQKIREKKKRVQKLSIQFRDALNALSSSLRAGLSLQKAIQAAHLDLLNIYDMKLEPIVVEFGIMVKELEAGFPVQDVLLSFSKRSKLDDIDDFVNIAITTLRRGGNLAFIIGNVTDMISDKIQIEQEIKTLVSGKKSEARILTFMPIGMVVLLSVLSPSYMAPMYNTWLGRGLLVLGLVLIVLNYFIGKKIVDIEV